MTKKEKKHLHKTLAKKWAKLIEALKVAGGKTLPYYDDGEDLQKAALGKISRLERGAPHINIMKLRDSLPKDVITKVSWHELKRITDNYNSDIKESNDQR